MVTELLGWAAAVFGNQNALKPMVLFIYVWTYAVTRFYR
jgi:hypothetical protein